jgi:hypothetical protein
MERKTNRPLKGLNVLSDALRLEEFPMDKQELYYSVGDILIGFPGRGASVPTRDLLDEIEGDEFDSFQEVIEAVKKVCLNTDRKAA